MARLKTGFNRLNVTFMGKDNWKDWIRGIILILIILVITYSIAVNSFIEPFKRGYEVSGLRGGILELVFNAVVIFLTWKAIVFALDYGKK